MLVTRLYPDEQGESHFQDIEIPLTDHGDIGQLSETVKATGIIFRTTSPNYDYDWHHAPRRQYIIILEGTVEITVSDGEKRVFSNGDVILVEDTTGKGHKSRCPDGKLRKSIFVTLD